LQSDFRNSSESLPELFRSSPKRTLGAVRQVRRDAVYCLACRKISRLDLEKMS